MLFSLQRQSDPYGLLSVWMRFEDLFTISVELHILYACKHVQASPFSLNSNHMSVNFDPKTYPLLCNIFLMFLSLQVILCAHYFLLLLRHWYEQKDIPIIYPIIVEMLTLSPYTDKMDALPSSLSNPSQQGYISELLSFSLDRLHKVLNGKLLHS